MFFQSEDAKTTGGMLTKIWIFKLQLNIVAFLHFIGILSRTALLRGYLPSNKNNIIPQINLTVL